MSIRNSLKKRRSYYNINKKLSVTQEDIVNMIGEVTELVPDAFNMKSARVVVLINDNHDLLWNEVEQVFKGKIPQEKLDGFRGGAGTVLFFYDEEALASARAKFPDYANRVEEWALQSNGMLQISVWTGLRDLNLGASLQHYNPVIDERVRDLFDVPTSYRLMAQMPFGGIGKEPDPKDKEDISKRVIVVK